MRCISDPVIFVGELRKTGENSGNEWDYRQYSFLPEGELKTIIFYGDDPRENLSEGMAFGDSVRLVLDFSQYNRVGANDRVQSTSTVRLVRILADGVDDLPEAVNG